MYTSQLPSKGQPKPAWGRNAPHAATSAAAASPLNRRRPVAEQRVLFSKVLRETPNAAAEPNKISVVERFITEVDDVPDRFRDVEVLFLSHNSISTFAGFAQFRRLRVLSLASNCIDRFSEIESLSSFPQLQVHTPCPVPGFPLEIHLQYPEVSLLPASSAGRVRCRAPLLCTFPILLHLFPKSLMICLLQP